MADANARKDMSIFSNELKLERLVYDFAVDGGATGNLDIGTASHDMVVVQAIVVVQTACTSGGSATVIIGAVSADPDAFLDITSGAVANLTANATFIEATAASLRIASGDIIRLTIGTAALTAGKIEVQLYYAKQ